MAEREKGKEKFHPNRALNGVVSYYILDAIDRGILRCHGDPDRKIALIDHFAKDPAMNDLDPANLDKQDFVGHKETVLALGGIAYEALSRGKEIKDLARGKFDPRLIAYAPQALLIYSYLPLLQNLQEIINGRIPYGFGQSLNRLQPHNSLAAGEMMKPASKRTAEHVAGMVVSKNTTDRHAILELGCGNASFSLSVLEAFRAQGLRPPQILATDHDPNTQPTATSLFREKGFIENLGLMKVDMGSMNDIRKAAEKLDGQNVLVHIGYILHENRKLAENTLSALSRVFGRKNVTFAFSEYYLQDEVSFEVPLWFQTIHALTQDLFRRDEFMDFVGGKFGLKMTGEVVHNIRKDNGQIMNSTTFWEK